MKFDVPAGTPRRSCLSCGRAIFWIETRGGKKMPVNADTFESHFADCPNADAHRVKSRQTSLFPRDGGRKP